MDEENNNKIPKKTKSTKEVEEEIEEEIMEQDPGVEEAKEEEKKQTAKKNILRRIYEFIWVSESPVSYIAFTIIAFVVLRFIFFPAFLFVTGYSDIAAVVSGSMCHDTSTINHNFDAWLEFYGFTKEEIANWPYQQGLSIGDVILVKKVSPEFINIGDIVLFDSKQGQIIHRVVSIKKVDDTYFYTTKGDANPAIALAEKDIPYTKIKGKLVSKIPFFGYPKVLLNMLIPKF